MLSVDFVNLCHTRIAVPSFAKKEVPRELKEKLCVIIKVVIYSQVNFMSTWFFVICSLNPSIMSFPAKVEKRRKEIVIIIQNIFREVFVILFNQAVFSETGSAEQLSLVPINLFSCQGRENSSSLKFDLFIVLNPEEGYLPTSRPMLPCVTLYPPITKISENPGTQGVKKIKKRADVFIHQQLLNIYVTHVTYTQSKSH